MNLPQVRPLLSRLFTCSAGLFVVSALLVSSPSARAHVGSPNVFFEGPAGPYPVRVTIEPPMVVPGLAQIHVRVHSGTPSKVTVLPVRYDVGTRGAPPPDVARRVAGETNLFTAQLWLMNSGSYSVFVDVTGPQGSGTAVVPLNSLALKRLGMPQWMSWVFLVLGIGVTFLLISVVGAAVRESMLPADAQPTRKRRLMAGGAMIATLFVSAGLLYIGREWWDAEDFKFRHNRLYQAQEVTPTISAASSGLQTLSLHVAPNRKIDSSPLVPDHEHLMHLFLIRRTQGDAFAHLHPHKVENPEGKGGSTWAVELPSMPAGEYHLYADITHETGLTQTLTNVVTIPASADGSDAARTGDPDDTMDAIAPQSPEPITLAGDFILKPALATTYKTGADITLHFDLTTATGAPAPLEPYLGMYGHLIIQDDTGGVFAHLHPLGSISMAAQRRFAEHEHEAYLANQPLELVCAPPTTALDFPYAFPAPGNYRIWLQTKLQGRVRTSVFKVTVE